MAYANGDTLCVDSLVRAWKFTSPTATSYLSMEGDTLFFTLTGVSADRDIVQCYVEEDGTKHCFYWDDGGSRFYTVEDIRANLFYSSNTGVSINGAGGLKRDGTNIILEGAGTNNLLLDAASTGSGILKLGETGDNDVWWLESRGRLTGSIADSTYTAGATEEIWIEQSAADTVYLPATPTAGDWYMVKFTNASGGVLAGNGKDIDGAATAAASENDAFSVIYNGTEWSIL